MSISETKTIRLQSSQHTVNDLLRLLTAIKEVNQTIRRYEVEIAEYTKRYPKVQALKEGLEKFGISFTWSDTGYATTVGAPMRSFLIAHHYLTVEKQRLADYSSQVSALNLTTDEIDDVTKVLYLLQEVDTLMTSLQE